MMKNISLLTEQMALVVSHWSTRFSLARNKEEKQTNT